MSGPDPSDPVVERVVVPLAEETVDIGIEEHVTGRVRVSVRTETFDREVEETLTGVSVNVTHVPIGRELAAGEAVPEARVENGMTIVPVLEERLVVEKRFVLVEELHIQQVASSEDVSVPVTLRRQRAEVERLPAEGSDADVRPGPIDPPP